MSTIAARAHSSAVLTAPAKRAAPARRKMSWFASLARGIGRRPGRSLMVLMFAGGAGVILANALFFQKMRHPAPMLSAPQVPRPAERKAETAATTPAAAIQPVSVAPAPVPPARPSALPQAAREAQPRPPAGVTAVSRTPAPAAAPAPAPAAPKVAAAPRDPIADLINGDMRPPAEIRGVSSGKPATPRRAVEN